MNCGCVQVAHPLTVLAVRRERVDARVLGGGVEDLEFEVEPLGEVRASREVRHDRLLEVRTGSIHLCAVVEPFD